MDRLAYDKYARSDSRITELVMSLEFVRKQRFKLKNIERPIYMRNVYSVKFTNGGLSLLLFLLFIFIFIPFYFSIFYF